MQNKLREYSDFPLRPRNPIGVSWLVLANLSKDSWQRLALAFAHRQRLRLEFYIDIGDGEENNRVFDDLARHRVQIEGGVGQPLGWERLEKRRASRIALYTDGTLGDEPERIEAFSEWAVVNALRFYSTISALPKDMSVSSDNSA